MRNKCDCYRESQRFEYNQFIMKGCMVPYSYCNGTKEQEECSCGGDKTKCDFYPEVRAEAKKKITIKDAINHFKYGISHDIFDEPVTTYAKMAVEALEKQMND